MEKVMLSNGLELPKLGMGVLTMRDDQEFDAAFKAALDAGYQLFDTAQSYGNEQLLGNAIKKLGVARDKVFITTKLKIVNCTYENARASVEESLKKLQSDYIDMLLIHHPYNDIYGAWRAMEEMYREGKLRAIGISNFQPDRFAAFMLFTNIKPMMHQVQINPYFQQNKLVRLTQKKGVIAEAYSPFAQGKFGIFSDPRLQMIADAHGKTPGQVMLRWLTQRDIVAIPKSANPARLKENIDIFDFTLTENEMQEIFDMDMNCSSLPQKFESWFVERICDAGYGTRAK